MTGFGVAEAADAAAQLIDRDLRGAAWRSRASAPSGRAAAGGSHELGATVVAVSTAAGAVRPGGLDVDRLSPLRAEIGDDCVDRPSEVWPSRRRPASDRPTCWSRLPARTSSTWTSRARPPPGWWSRARTCRPRAGPADPARARHRRRAGLHRQRRRDRRRGALDGRPQLAFVVDRPVFAMIADKLRSNSVTVLEKASREGLLPHDAARTLAQERVHAAMLARGQVPSMP